VVQTTWVRNMCELIGYCPELGARIWSEIVDRMLRIDVSLALGFSVPFYRIASARIMEDVPDLVGGLDLQGTRNSNHGSALGHRMIMTSESSLPLVRHPIPYPPIPTIGECG
jgi:hypothetical protein